ncbi:MAG: hypothetical protein AB1724_13455 [Thermodesulfobacteriota bacterium]
MDVSPDGSGTISSYDFSSPPTGYPTTYTCSLAYGLTATANTSAGYVFDHWSILDGTDTTILTDSAITVEAGNGGKIVTAVFIKPAGSTYLYFPHVDTTSPWQTEIAVINTGSLTVTGMLKAYSDAGQLVDIIDDVTLAPKGRRQITVASEFINHTSIGYIVFIASADSVQGYTKLFKSGIYRAAIPAVADINTSDIYVSHIASNSSFWTLIALVNTNSTAKNVTFTFNDGRSAVVTISAYGHKDFTIASLFGGQEQPDIKSAVISNAAGIIGLELFGTVTYLDGLLLTDQTVSTIYYPHLADVTKWWTGVVAYNTSAARANITITPYSAEGTALTPSALTIDGLGKYVGVVKNLNLPAEAAWFRLDASQPVVGFELFGTLDGKQLAAYADDSGTGAKQGAFAKLEKSGWTGIAFVNTEGAKATVTLKAHNDSGTVIAIKTISVNAYAKVVKMAESIFSPQSITSATYITFTSDKNVVGFQLNGSSDSKLLDGLPALN